MSPVSRPSIGSSNKNIVCFQCVGVACGPVENTIGVEGVEEEEEKEK